MLTSKDDKNHQLFPIPVIQTTKFAKDLRSNTGPNLFSRVVLGFLNILKQNEEDAEDSYTHNVGDKLWMGNFNMDG